MKYTDEQLAAIIKNAPVEEMNFTVAQVTEILSEAKNAAWDAAQQYFNQKLGGQDGGACGFAWVNIHGIKGNTKLGKAMKAAGIDKSYTGAFQIWNPSKFPVQNISVLEVGADAAAKVFKKYGFQAYAGSRLD